MTLPLGAKLLLDFIGNIEAPRGYDTIYGNNQGKLEKPLTQMTLDEIIAAQAGWSKRFGSSAAGRYQFMRATLRGLMAELGLPGSLVLDAALQDRLGHFLLVRRGYDAFVAGRISTNVFARQIAQEWASLPVLVSVQGAHRLITRGESYYSGDGKNKELTKPEDVEAILAKVKSVGGMAYVPPPVAVEPEPEDALAPPPVTSGNVAAGVVGWAIVGWAIVAVVVVMALIAATHLFFPG